MIQNCNFLLIFAVYLVRSLGMTDSPGRGSESPAQLFRVSTAAAWIITRDDVKDVSYFFLITRGQNPIQNNKTISSRAIKVNFMFRTMSCPFLLILPSVPRRGGQCGPTRVITSDSDCQNFRIGN